MNIQKPVIIAHRGASGYLPEHTLAAYKLAIAQGANFIEPDLVPTRDGVLISRHENNIAETTDVSAHPEFADRRTQHKIDGQVVDGWFTEDFTLDELKTLKARGRNKASSQHNDEYPIATFQEVIDLAKGAGVGIYPETKHPSYFRSIGLPIEERLVDQLDRNGLNRPDAPVAIQSFEVGNLKALNLQTDVRLVQLVWTDGAPQDFLDKGDKRTYADMMTAQGLAEVATYADIVAPHKEMILAPQSDGVLSSQASQLVTDAHAAGLLVHAYTFAADNIALPRSFQKGSDPQGLGDLTSEVKAYFAAGVDGVFSNHPDLAVAALPRV